MTDAEKEKVREREESRRLAARAEAVFARDGFGLSSLPHAVHGLTYAVLSVAAAIRGLEK